jgi:catechol 2,3-dioxygenase-like lactoylglutathione lyase family enzyme
MIVDHVGFGVSDYPRAKRFYTEALAPLGFTLVMEVSPEQNEGGKVGRADSARTASPSSGSAATARRRRPCTSPSSSTTRAAVRAFHEAALRAGGRDNGAPGLRPQYHPNYYGAFVRDLDGHNVEAVCHAAE